MFLDPEAVRILEIRADRIDWMRRRRVLVVAWARLITPFLYFNSRRPSPRRSPPIGVRRNRVLVAATQNSMGYGGRERQTFLVSALVGPLQISADRIDCKGHGSESNLGVAVLRVHAWAASVVPQLAERSTKQPQRSVQCRTAIVME
jgi:hypothetical protein